MTDGNDEPRGNTGTPCGTIVDQIGKKDRVRFIGLIVSRLGRNVFSPPVALKKRITYTFESGNQQKEGWGRGVITATEIGLGSLTSFKLEIDAGIAPSSPGVVNARKPGGATEASRPYGRRSSIACDRRSGTCYDIVRSTIYRHYFFFFRQ